MRPPDFWTKRDFISQFAVAVLTPFGWLYGASVVYRAGHTHSYRSTARVLCVGNLTAGGTGKTPIAMQLAHALIARGARPVFLTRGYGGSERGPAFVAADDNAAHVGDEPLLLASIAPVIVSRDRAAGARLAEQQRFDCIIMDDGHQNFSLEKDLSLIVVDSESGFGNNRVLPAGPLREPVSQGLKRADAVIIRGSDTPAALANISIPVLRVHLSPVGDNHLAGQDVVAFAGIGRPENFFASLARMGAKIVEARPYGDHHIYTQSELARLKARARAANALLVTTEKDYVRLTRAERDGIEAVPVRAEFDDLSALDSLLDRLVPRAVPPKTS